MLQSQAFVTARRAVASSDSDSNFVSVAAEEEEEEVVVRMQRNDRTKRCISVSPPYSICYLTSFK